jgi:cobalt/nickel transport system permease protein
MEILSEYLQTDHRLSRLDPRLKLGVALVLLILVLTHQGFVFPLLIAGIAMVLLLQMRIPFKAYLLRLLEPLFIIFMLVLLKTLFTGREVLASFSFGGWTVAAQQDGLVEGLRLGARIIGAVSIITILSFCTSFTQFMAGLSWFKVPQGLIEILLFAYRYIFVLLEEAQVIYQAQKNRFGYVTAARGLQSFGTLTGSLILKVFEHSQNVSISMVQRGYDGNLPLMKYQAFKTGEILASCGCLVLFGILWTITR